MKASRSPIIGTHSRRAKLELHPLRMVLKLGLKPKYVWQGTVPSALRWFCSLPLLHETDAFNLEFSFANG